MIFISFTLFAITLLIILYPLVRPQPKTQDITLQDIYKKNYVTLEARLTSDLNSGTLTQEAFDHQKTEAARDLLKMTQKGQDKLSKPAQFIIIGIALVLPLVAIAGFWRFSYTPEIQRYDSERTRLIKAFSEWRDMIPESELNSRNNIVMIQPQPRDPDIFNQLQYGFPALFFMSAKETHSNPQTLKLLGKILYDVKWLPAAHEVYSRVLELTPTDFIANATLIDMELQNTKSKISAPLATKIERFLALYPQDTSVRVQYAQKLYESEQVEKSIVEWRTIRNIFAQNKNPEQQAQVAKTLEAIDMILTSIDQREMETSQVRNYMIDVRLFDKLDWSKLTTPAILTIYLIDLEENRSLAYKETLITPETGFPNSATINDFDRFDDAKEPIRSYEHLAIFGEITNSNDKTPIYTTDLIEIPKGAYESAIMFSPSTKNNDYSKLMQATIQHTEDYKAKSFLVEVNLPTVDLTNLPDDATLNLFVSPKGSRMPVAAKAIRSAKNLTFPITVNITDKDKLMEASPSLFTYKNLEVGARLSMSTESVGKAGDIDSAKNPIAPDNRVTTLVIDQVRETSKATPVVPN